VRLLSLCLLSQLASWTYKTVSSWCKAENRAPGRENKRPTETAAEEGRKMQTGYSCILINSKWGCFKTTPYCFLSWRYEKQCALMCKWMTASFVAEKN
jgi:hypothetical protein